MSPSCLEPQNQVPTQTTVPLVRITLFGEPFIINEGPKSLDRLEQYFKDIVATSYSAWAPSEDPNPEEFNQNNEGFESGGDMNYTNEFIEEDIANYTVVQSPTREKRRKTSNKKIEKRAGITSRLQDSLDRILVGVESKAATKGDDPYSIENCIKLLRKLSGLEPYSPQFYMGIRLMVKPQYRETFIALSDDPNQQLGWLESFKLDDMSQHEKDYESAAILAICGVANYYL
ncbi:hypothetical protein Ahy_A02g008685 [Arachis hypogaea]|uniref:Uncharacterized protein n=1 Tax=Arachis hypogaea TaxID=3818 RepID=A0A445EFJ6_ARAHY|nr:hypothetical protein Ahy_A02g008685 [Arachis hypogaea]